jgi:glycosyltransferase involved in cell wall biosynthesis
MSLRIAQLAQESSRNGGVGAYVTQLCEALVEAGHKVSLIHANPTSNFRPSGDLQDFCVPQFAEFASHGASAKRAEQILEILQTVQPDVVHIQSNNNFVLETALRERFPTIKSLHVYDFCPSGNKFHHLLGKVCNHSTGALCMLRMGYKRCLLTKRPGVIWNHYGRCVSANQSNAEHRRLIVASQYVKQQAMASGYEAGKIEVLPYFVRLPEANSVRESDRNTVLFVGRVTREKGLTYLLNALAQMRPTTRLVVAGTGGDLVRAKRLARRLGLSRRTEFLGWVDAPGLASLYASASVVAVPSVWPEPFGIVGLEAMSHAKPVVAFRVGGIPEWLQDGVTGHLVSACDIGAMAARLTHLLDNPEAAREMGMRGRESAERHFDPEDHVARLIEILREVMDVRTCSATRTA